LQAHAASDAEAEARRAVADLALTESGAPQAQPEAVQLPRMVSALHHRNYRFFWAGNFLSNVGTWMQSVAMGWLVFQLTNSAFWLGMVGFASQVPMLVFALWGGVIADRVNRRTMLMRSQAAMMVFAFLLAGLTFANVITVKQVAVLTFLTGVAMSLAMPAHQALVPALVPRKDLTNAIALNSAQFNLSRVLGPMLGGFAMASFGVAGNFLLNGISFLAVLYALSRIEYPAQQPDVTGSLYRKLIEGFRYVHANREMRALIVLITLSSLLSLPYINFIPLFAREILGVGERGLGVLMACSGAGAFAAAATIAYTAGKVKRRGRLVATSGIVLQFAVIGFCFSRWFALSAVLLGLSGFAMILMVANVNSLLQHLAADEMRGRVMSIYATAYVGFVPIGSLIAGALSEWVPAPRALAAMSAVALVATLYLYYFRPTLRRMD
jgi:MFS family permease